MIASVRLRIRCIFLLTVLSCYGVSPSIAVDEFQPPSGSNAQIPWVRRQGNATAKGVIVFVHGVLGDAKSTWSNGQAYWPSLLTRDHAFDGQDIYVYQYPAPKFGYSFTVDEVAENLRLKLTNEGVMSYQRMSFVSHSMGGIVTRAFILKYQNLVVPKIRLLYFFATPTSGSPYATLASWVTKNAQFKDIYPMKSDSYLAPLERNWLDANLRLKSYCAYEAVPMRMLGLKIVEMDSATLLCTEHPDPIDENHIDIVKPANTSSTAYVALRAAFLETAAQAPEKSTHVVSTSNLKASVAPAPQRPREKKEPPTTEDRPTFSIVQATYGGPSFAFLVKNSGSLPAFSYYSRLASQNARGLVAQEPGPSTPAARQIQPGDTTNGITISSQVAESTYVAMCVRYADAEDYEARTLYAQCFYFKRPATSDRAQQIEGQEATRLADHLKVSGFETLEPQRFARSRDQSFDVAAQDTPERRAALREKTLRFVVALENFYKPEEALWRDLNEISNINPERAQAVRKDHWSVIQFRWKSEFYATAKELLFQFSAIGIHDEHDFLKNDLTFPDSVRTPGALRGFADGLRFCVRVMDNPSIQH
jgi:pimeloyl-ACP methyl ester carboxylesterase